MIIQSWVSPKTEKDMPSKIHKQGFFAIAPIAKGEIVAVKQGHVIDKQKLQRISHIIRGSEMQICDNLYLAPLTAAEFAKSMIYINHCCEPNCGIAGNTMFVAMEDIRVGDELTIDYAMDNASPDYRMDCICQTPSCRHVITGNDWRLPELQQRYAGYFSWYVEQNIKGEIVSTHLLNVNSYQK